MAHEPEFWGQIARELGIAPEEPTPPDVPARFVRAKTVARRLALPIRSVYRLIESGELRGLQTGGRGFTVLIDSSSVDAFLARRLKAFSEQTGGRD